MCMSSMCLQKMKVRDGFTWMCRRKFCKNTKTIQDGSIFKYANLPLQQLVFLFYLFSLDFLACEAHSLMPQVFRKSIYAFYGKLRKKSTDAGKSIKSNGFLELTSRTQSSLCQDTENDEGIAKIDESKMGKKQKFNNACCNVKRKWVVGFVQRGTRKAVLHVVEHKNAATLLPIIRKHVQNVTTIYCDEWKAYGRLREDNKHSIVCHEHEFVTADGTHTNTIDGEHLNRVILRRFKLGENLKNIVILSWI